MTIIIRKDSVSTRNNFLINSTKNIIGTINKEVPLGIQLPKNLTTFLTYNVRQTRDHITMLKKLVIKYLQVTTGVCGRYKLIIFI